MKYDEVLGISENATQIEVQEAYVRWVLLNYNNLEQVLLINERYLSIANNSYYVENLDFIDFLEKMLIKFISMKEMFAFKNITYYEIIYTFNQIIELEENRKNIKLSRSKVS